MAVGVQFIELQAAGGLPLRVAVLHIIREAGFRQLFAELILDRVQFAVRDDDFVNLKIGLELLTIRNVFSRTGAGDHAVRVNDTVQVGAAFGRENLNVGFEAVNFFENTFPIPMRVGDAVIIDLAGKHRAQAGAFLFQVVKGVGDFNQFADGGFNFHKLGGSFFFFVCVLMARLLKIDKQDAREGDDKTDELDRADFLTEDGVGEDRHQDRV